MPEGPQELTGSADGRTLRGFSLHDREAWAAVLPQIGPGRLYLFTISKPTSRVGYGLLHYHVGLILADNEGGKWLYQTTGSRGHSYRLNLATDQGMDALQSSFRQTGRSQKMMLILEVNYD